MNAVADADAAPRLSETERDKLAGLMARAWASRGDRFKGAMARVISNLEDDGWRIVPPVARTSS